MARGYVRPEEPELASAFDEGLVIGEEDFKAGIKLLERAPRGTWQDAYNRGYLCAFYKHRSRWGSLESRKAQYKRNTLRRANAKKITAAEDFSRMEILERDGWHCRKCGRLVLRKYEKGNPASPVIHHVIPLALGGQHTKENVRLLCAGCHVEGGWKARLGEE